MSIENEVALWNTRAKLERVQARYDALRQEAAGDSHTRDLTLRSLKKLINQFQEEVARYEAHQPARG